jgi:hypothetical protein
MNSVKLVFIDCFCVVDAELLKIPLNKMRFN